MGDSALSPTFMYGTGGSFEGKPKAAGRKVFRMVVL